MAITRSEFCSALVSASALLILQGCGGGSDYSSSPAPAPGPAPGPGPAPAPQCGASGAAIAGNHGHVLAIPRADLDSAMPIAYHIQATAGHDHIVALSSTQLQMLKAGDTLTVTSSFNGHDHVVTVNCP